MQARYRPTEIPKNALQSLSEERPLKQPVLLSKKGIFIPDCWAKAMKIYQEKIKSVKQSFLMMQKWYIELSYNNSPKK